MSRLVFKLTGLFDKASCSPTGEGIAYDDLPQSTPIVSRQFNDTQKWVLKYDEHSKNPLWVYEHLSKRNNPPKGDDINRKNTRFFSESSFPDIFKITPNDYNNSGYDRGHMAPAADFMQTQELLDSTFTMANICPQNPTLNKGFWAKLEGLLRKMIHHDYEEIFVVTGPVYAPKYIKGQWVYAHTTIGVFPKLIKVPTHFFKIIVGKRYSNIPNNSSQLQYQQTIIGSFLVPNEDISADAPIENYLVKLDQLEAIVGVKFFTKTLVDDSLRKKIDDAVPPYRDLTVVLDPVTSAYNNLLPKGNTTNTKQIQANIVKTQNQPGTTHICTVLDCSQNITQWLSTPLPSFNQQYKKGG